MQIIGRTRIGPNGFIGFFNFFSSRYVSNTVIGCGLFKMNKADEAHEKLTNVWNWLDSLDETHEPSYVAIRDGLKHVVMSSLCHGLYAVNKPQCRQVSSIIDNNYLSRLLGKYCVLYALRDKSVNTNKSRT